MIDNEALSELKGLFAKHYGARLTDEQALRAGEKLIELMKVVGRPGRQTIDMPPSRDNNKSKI